LLVAAEGGGGTTSTPVSAENDATKAGADATATATATANPTTTPTKIEVKSSAKTKDPDEASSYLTLWTYDRKNQTKTWKFNKNTQSWLSRHMYDFDKVSKTTFSTLVEYLCEGGDRAMARVEEDAKRRARRYKDWEKKSSQAGEGEEEATKGGGDEANKDGEKDGEGNEKKKAQSAEDAAWNELDDHDKRKEYKRARKVLDSLKDAKQKKIDAHE